MYSSKQWNLMYENARLQIGFFEHFNLAATFIQMFKLANFLFRSLVDILFIEKKM